MFNPVTLSGDRDNRKKITYRWRVPLQVFLSFLISMVLPFGLYVCCDEFLGLDVTPYFYVVTVTMLVAIAVVVWIECFLAIFLTKQPPEKPLSPYPPASAIIAAYLPNEQETILQTIHNFLNVKYPAPLQIILAYNTPIDLPELEDNLAEVARLNPDRFLPFRVIRSRSKAENVNAALGLAKGEFVGVFDADHNPSLDSFTRAWKWLSSGYDVVQGHCLVRNGEDGWVARSVAVEFETIYAIGHPGSELLHNFGFFGGSNGFWRTKLLTQIRMDGSMLTEDIDSSIRAVLAGGKIKSDPGLISTELATTTIHQIWNQRLRWSQGWFQVSLKYFLPGMVCQKLTLWQRLGMFHLFVLREVYPWISVQIMPLLAFLVYKENWLATIQSLHTLFLACTLFNFSCGPAQTMFAYWMSNQRVKSHPAWWWTYLLFSLSFYTEFKNVIVRVSHIKEFMREKTWVVTPRSVSQQSLEKAVMDVVV